MAARKTAAPAEQPDTVDAPEQAPEVLPDEATVKDMLGAANPYELVRAKDATTGAEYTCLRVAALNAGSTVLDKPAVDAFGQIVPTKTVLDLRAEATPTDAGTPGTDNKE